MNIAVPAASLSLARTLYLAIQMAHENLLWMRELDRAFPNAETLVDVRRPADYAKHRARFVEGAS